MKVSAPTRAALRTALVVLVISITTSICARQVDCSFGMSKEQFSKLSMDDRRDVVIAAFEHRLKHGQNVHYRVLVSLHNSEFKNDKVGKTVWAGIKFGFEHWRLGDSYRMDTDQYGDVSNHTPLQHVSSSFDAREGRSRGTVKSSRLKGTYARIDQVHSPVIVHNRYVNWLDGVQNSHAHHVFRLALNARSELQVELSPKDSFIIVKFPWTPYREPKPIGEWVLHLDPIKGFLPIQAYGQWEKGTPTLNQSYRREKFIINESLLVGDVWMPASIQEVVQASTLDSSLANVWNTKITEIRQGEVSAKDLVVPIEKGMRVVDAIAGVSYTADEAGKAAGPIRPFGSRPAARAGASLSGSSNRRWLIGLNLAIVLFLLGIIAKRYLVLPRRSAPIAD